MEKYMKIKLLVLLLAFGLVAYSCDSGSSSDPDVELDAIVGVWVSQGAGNVAPGLAMLTKTAKIDAEFNSNNTYNVVSIDSSNVAVTFTGNWTVGEPNANGIRSITLNQSTPTQLVATGIFRIQGNTMEYEVIQSQPALDGVVPPTTAGGFGSTNIGGNPTGPFWIQKFARVNN
jgi:hypothetical protein